MFYIQSTTDFPSWTSRVRSPSPALLNQQLGKFASRFYPIITQLRGTSIHKGRSEDLNRLDSAFQRRFGVNVQIHVQGVSLLIRDNLWINAEPSHKGSMRPPHDVEIHPAKACLFEFWPNISPHRIVAGDWLICLLRRE